MFKLGRVATRSCYIQTMNVIQGRVHAGSGQAGGEWELRGRSSVEGEALVRASLEDELHYNVRIDGFSRVPKIDFR